MGSLHPANRLAAYITGRLNAPGKILHKNSEKPDPTQKNNIQSTLHIKAAGTVVPPIITARKTTDLKTPTQQPGKIVSVTGSQHKHLVLNWMPPKGEESNQLEGTHACSCYRILKSSDDHHLYVLFIKLISY